jgi:hypothetical protein
MDPVRELLRALSPAEAAELRRAARRAGVSVEELAEVFMLLALYEMGVTFCALLAIVCPDDRSREAVLASFEGPELDEGPEREESPELDEAWPEDAEPCVGSAVGPLCVAARWSERA